MKKNMILLAGYPATGKTFLCNKILAQHPQFEIVSQDELKEHLWIEHGFDNMEEKTALEYQSWDMYYELMENKMKDGRWIISDYPFSDKQKGKLEALSSEYNYQVITVRLTGDIDTLYERSRARDLDPTRNLAHLVSRYHKGDEMEDRSKADCLVTHDIFWERCTTRGYDKFQLGHLIEVDVTDFSKVNYDEILKEISSYC